MNITKIVSLPSVMLLMICLISLTSAAILPEPCTLSSCCLDDSISVSGQGRVAVQPDIALVNIGVSVISKTSQ